MQPNQNPIDFDSQGNMLIPSVQSPNYVTGSTGWAVKKDGSAEFNNLIIRGATTVDNVSLYYNGTPAAGNLVASIAASQGTDTYGNTYYAGIVAYDNTHGTFVQMVNGEYYAGKQGQSISNIVVIGYGSNNNAELGTDPCAVIEAPTDGTYTSKSAVIAIPGTGSTQATAPTILHVSPDGSQPCNTRVSGSVIKTDNFGSALQWQTPSLGTGWAAGPSGGSYRSLKYRLDAENNLVISGTVHTTSTTPASTIFTLSAGYIPKSDERPGVVSNQGGAYTARSLEINHTTGAVVIDPVPTVASMDIYVYACIPMGDLS